VSTATLGEIKKGVEVVSAHPEEALAIILTWLHQPV
jgi:hypothetical protein